MNDGKTIFQAESDAFQYSANEMASVMAGGEADPAAACIGIEVRSPFTLKIGQEDKAIATCEGSLGLYGASYCPITSNGSRSGTHGTTMTSCTPSFWHRSRNSSKASAPG